MSQRSHKASFLYRLIHPRKVKEETFLRLADEARDIREWVNAEAHYSSYLELRPDNNAIHIQHGHALKELGRLDEAEAAYNRAMKIEPADPDLHLQLGHLMKIQGQFDRAIEYYRQALKLAPDLHDAKVELDTMGAPASPRSLDDEVHSVQRQLDEWTRAIVRLETAVRATTDRCNDLENKFSQLTAHLNDLRRDLRQDIGNLVVEYAATLKPPEVYDDVIRERFSAVQQSVDEVRIALIKGLSTTRAELVRALEQSSLPARQKRANKTVRSVQSKFGNS
jgi:tetratricopeptide (TPR) repeat protein